VTDPLWWDDPEVAAARANPRPPLDGSVDADVAILGGGFTGLWTALHVLKAEPATKVVVVEGRWCGFGASGRNGGWASAGIAGKGMDERMQAAVDDLKAATDEEGIDCHYVKGGTLQLARSTRQARRLEKDEHRLSGDEMAARLRASGVVAGAWTPHCARVQPARLCVGLAAAVARRGGRIVEATAATGVEPGRITTTRGDVRAPLVVRATEGFTARLPAFHRHLAPVHSLMIATEPLPPETWQGIGWEGRETVWDGRRLLVYAQRTADDRIAFGGRGAPYLFGSRIVTELDDGHPVFADLGRALVDLFPDTAGAAITHRWGGPIGVARNLQAGVGIDRSTGLAWAGGYIGDGVTTAYLAGRTLADLLLGRDTDDTKAPWVGRQARRWEPEPLRWVGINGVLRLAARADRRDVRQ
jgi:glycine/D-amino acid oxidase-like deaminating enzyme